MGVRADDVENFSNCRIIKKSCVADTTLVHE